MAYSISEIVVVKFLFTPRIKMRNTKSRVLFCDKIIAIVQISLIKFLRK
jgi:hypothetical protein